MLRCLTPRRTSLWLCGALLAQSVVFSGCMKPEEKVLQVVTPVIEKCRADKEVFHEVTLFDKKKRTVLKGACDEPMSDVEMLSEWGAQVKTGPVEWVLGLDDESRAWVVSDVKWADFDRVMRFRVDGDLEPDTLQRVETSLASAQEALPKSDWIRLERLKNLLELRQKTRKAGDPDPANIGEAARTYFDELTAWAKEVERPDVALQAQLQVIEHLRKYKNRQEMAMEAIGSQDEWLERSMKVALDEGDKKQAEEIRQELEEKRANAVTERETVQKRIDAAQQNICAEVEKVSVSGVEDEDLRAQAVNLKSGTQCAAAADSGQ